MDQEDPCMLSLGHITNNVIIFLFVIDIFSKFVWRIIDQPLAWNLLSTFCFVCGLKELEWMAQEKNIKIGWSPPVRFVGGCV
jgi:hypothetical protein